jgi:hypothetical protein
MVLITILALAVLAFVGKLIYDVQQKKNKPTKNEDGFEFKDDFQKLAGIKPIENTTSELPTNVTTKKLNEQIVEALLKAAENSEFPKSDESINVRTTKITTIDTNFGDNDPLATIPMSRVSVEGKKKMAQIAKEDIKVTTKAKADKLASIFPDVVEYTDEYSKPDYSNVKPKKKSNPKQMDGTKNDAPFVKTKKKATK